MRKHALTVLLFSLMILTAPATAGVVFDNYPINGTIAGWTIDYGFQVSDSFTLNSGATVNGVNFGVWLFTGDSITAVDWSIGAKAFGDSVGSGTANVSLAASPAPYSNGYGYTIASETFSFSDLNLAAGTYYLTLQNAAVPSRNPAYWDISNAPGIDAWENSIGNVSASGVCLEQIGVSGTCASSFQILGATAAAPEPATWTLLGSGILAVFALRRKVIGR